MPTYANQSWGRRFRTRIAVFMCAGLAGLAGLAPGTAHAQMATAEQAMSEMSIGRADAPVTLNEYASLTCGHCANFHKNTLPQIKKEYVDTGKVRIVFHDFPLGNLAKGALMIARCAGPDRFADLTDMLFQTQENWASSENPLGSLIALTRFYGLNGDDVNACLNNQSLMKFVETNAANASAIYNIQSTPSFVLEGKLIEGAQGFDVFQKALDDALAAKGVK